ncbi:Metallophosphoesterase domain protein [Cordyceps fumosorosea ARSEF 2679]|uniref:Metallophosphoesterase domain protein n=1 Tax=Cordyceps fumosorosea (strain ARSEF 2679) TaxID=1081104 RepID=A0A168EBP0_CORFA|nr:Metallophosphoesterase domain protein [Cordyceps fumosorosea ARSEF 2679]OAA73618.1 Metallophosphoesterase domain protein [Cordyceps fumosorosea ARSEF 2679]
MCIPSALLMASVDDRPSDDRPSIPALHPPRPSPWRLLRQSPTLFLARLLYPYRATAAAPLISSSSSSSSPASASSISVVCISDTHNTQPPVPDGDLLLHAGNLTVRGTLAELRAQVAWLASLPHPHKVVIAGNHDLCLDAAFLARSPPPPEDDGAPLPDWAGAGITYLDGAAATLTLRGGRTLTVYGSPLTPAFGRWAFQHHHHHRHPASAWPGGPATPGVDVLLTHGPPRGLLDGDGRGCPLLRREVARARPRLLVCGHVHAGRGVATLRHDRFQAAHDEVEQEGGGAARGSRCCWSGGLSSGTWGGHL